MASPAGARWTHRDARDRGAYGYQPDYLRTPQSQPRHGSYARSRSCVLRRCVAHVNTNAILSMIGFVVGWLALAGIALFAGRLFAVAFLVLTVVALFLYVPWIRLNTSGVDGSSRPMRFWVNFAMLAVVLGAFIALGFAIARRFWG